jgi:hypothetical protein
MINIQQEMCRSVEGSLTEQYTEGCKTGVRMAVPEEFSLFGG